MLKVPSRPTDGRAGTLALTEPGKKDSRLKMLCYKAEDECSTGAAIVCLK
jgi:hypothetical protein